MIKRLPAEKWHMSKKAKMINFAGYYMPVSYTSIIEEHLAVRKKAGFFDISHMGQIWIKGIDSATWLNEVTCNDISNLNPGKAQYSMLLNEKGGVVDDIIVYMISIDEFLLVVNAANIEKDFYWLKSKARGSVKIIERSDEFGLVAVAGKKARDVLSRMFPSDAIPTSSFHFKKANFHNYEVIISATGYTGEETSFEIFVPAERTAEVLEAIDAAGSEFGCLPCGLGARDSLRIEASLPLYGQELTEERTPIESGLAWVVKLKKPNDFIGKKAILDQMEKGFKNTIGHYVVEGPGPIPRTNYPVFDGNGQEIGKVTSGTYSPLLNKSIFMAFVQKEYAEPGTKVFVGVRDKMLSAKAVRKPFLQIIKEGGR